jgi:hypothetical protein
VDDRYRRDGDDGKREKHDGDSSEPFDHGSLYTSRPLARTPAAKTP